MKAKDADHALYLTSKALLNAPEYSPRGKKTKELIQFQIEIEDPSKCVITNKARKLNQKYLAAELDWYKSGDLSIHEIGRHASLWKHICDENGIISSNYGNIVFKQKMPTGENQYNWAVKSLKKDKNSRQALINFNQPMHKYNSNKDFVCTINTQYLIRDKKLIGITNMRSNDLIYGFCYDFPFFSDTQKKIAKAVNKKMGSNFHTAGSMHVYEKHFKMLENIVTEYEKNKPKSLELNRNIYKD